MAAASLQPSKKTLSSPAKGQILKPGYLRDRGHRQLPGPGPPEAGGRPHVRAETFDLTLTLEKGKGAFWHADNGVLAMGGEADPRRRTVYYSYTNMPTRGEVILHDPEGENKTMQVTGKSWFDRQWGTYAITKINTHWEWFSMRFFDNEEVMLFSFPQCSYFDGTYIGAGGERQRLRNYTITPKGFTEAAGIKFSKGWDLNLPGVKEEQYEIRPLIDGQLNLFYLVSIRKFDDVFFF